MDNKEQITTRTYKIKAIVIGILAVMVYIASQYVMFCNLPILESTGERVETDFLKWVINRNIGCIVLGIILMLIPYEWLADKFIKSHEKKLKKSAYYRRRHFVTNCSSVVSHCNSHRSSGYGNHLLCRQCDCSWCFCISVI